MQPLGQPKLLEGGEDVDGDGFGEGGAVECDAGEGAGDAISLDYLAWGCDQLRGLSKLILEALHASQEKHEKRLEECLAELQTLPGGLYPNPRTQKK